MKIDKKDGNEMEISITEKKNILAALVKAQMGIQVPKKDKTNGAFKYKYASLDSIYNACRPALFEQGLTLMHDMVEENGKLTLITTLYHVSGESICNSFPLCIEKTNSQGMASARTYACRYAICNLLALPSDEDDDGEMASKEKREPLLTENEVQYIQKIVDKYPHLIEVLQNAMKAMKIQSLSEMKQKDYTVIITLLKTSVESVKSA